MCISVDMTRLLPVALKHFAVSCNMMRMALMSFPNCTTYTCSERKKIFLDVLLWSPQHPTAPRGKSDKMSRKSECRECIGKATMLPAREVAWDISPAESNRATEIRRGTLALGVPRVSGLSGLSGATATSWDPVLGSGASASHRSSYRQSQLPELLPLPPLPLPSPLLLWLSYPRADHQVRCHGKDRARCSSFKILPSSSATRQQ